MAPVHLPASGAAPAPFFPHQWPGRELSPSPGPRGLAPSHGSMRSRRCPAPFRLVPALTFEGGPGISLVPCLKPALCKAENEEKKASMEADSNNLPVSGVSGVPLCGFTHYKGAKACQARNHACCLHSNGAQGPINHPERQRAEHFLKE